MEINTAAARKRIGETFTFRCVSDIASETYLGRPLVFSEPLLAEGSYVFDGDAFTLMGTIETAFDSVCARCAEPYVEPFSCAFEERFVKASAWKEDSDCYFYEGDKLIITGAVMDNLFLHLPLVSVCREDCKGLCPVCGANRNRGDCGCERAGKDNPFSVLQSLSNEYKEV